MRTSPFDPDLLAHRALGATDKDALACHSGHYLPRSPAVGDSSGDPCPVCLFLEMCAEYPGEVAASLALLVPPRCPELPVSDAASGELRTKENVLAEADRIVHGDRQNQYGSPRDSLSTTAALWGPIFGTEVTPEQVALAMIELKVARILAGSGRDSFVDLAGYAGVLALVAGVDDE